MRKEKIRQAVICLVMNIFILIILLLPLKQGQFFGTNGDWYSQHITIADSLRQAILKNKSLIPQFISLGGGSSIYDFAYYGLLRPDILISCLFPKIEMRYFIAVYAICGVLASVDLCYFWLMTQKIEEKISIMGALTLGMATCFFHAHHQIMFVNYMPFLILACMGVDCLLQSKRSAVLVLSLFFIYIHSFYYAISGLAVVGIYFLYQLGKQKEITYFWREKKLKYLFFYAWKYMKKAIAAVMLSIGLAMVLLLPMAMDILSTKKDGGSFQTTIEAVNFCMNGLLYSPYGCGFTLIALFSLFRGLFLKGRRILSAVLLLVFSCPVISYVLNCFLYARTKILIPFSVLIVLLLADNLQDLYKGSRKHIVIPMILCMMVAFLSKYTIFAYIDGVILIAWIFSLYLKRFPRLYSKVFGWFLIVPFTLTIGIGMSGSYLKDICRKLGIRSYAVYLETSDNRQNHISDEQIEMAVTDSRYRLDVLSNNFINSNLMLSSRCGRTSMYSSVTNADYADFYYNTMKNSIGVNNRVALTPSSNPCFAYLMGMKYIVTRKDQVPEGYHVVSKTEDYALSKNDHVLPVCYGTTNLMNQATYQQLEFPQNMVSLCQNTVVASVEGDSQRQEATAYQKAEKSVSRMSADAFFKPESCNDLENIGKVGKTDLELRNAVFDYFMVLSFDVKRKNGDAVQIEINGITNKLSAKNAPYPNGNEHFVYVIPLKEGAKNLNVKAKKGNYSVENVSVDLIKKDAIVNDSVIMPLQYPDTNDGKTVFSGSIEMKEDGYFVTSYPYKKGYHVKVDSSYVDVEKVNTAFVGVPLSEGRHVISIYYIAPGFYIGAGISVFSMVCFLLMLAKEREISVFLWLKTYKKRILE